MHSSAPRRSTVSVSASWSFSFVMVLSNARNAAPATTALPLIVKSEGVSGIFPGSRLREARNRFATRRVLIGKYLLVFDLLQKQWLSAVVPAKAGTHTPQ